MHGSKRIPLFASVALLAYMPFHVFLSQSISLLTGGLDYWKVGKDVVLLLMTLFTICLVRQKGKADKAFYGLLLWTVLYGGLHLLLMLTNPDLHSRSALVGITYNMRLPLFLVLGYGAVLLYQKFAFSSLVKVLLVVSSIVAGLGVLQYFLPSDTLTHVGYGLDRGTRAAFFIDSDTNLPRIMSTLREPNALGAYLIVPIALLTQRILSIRRSKSRYISGAALLVHLTALYLTFSRSAWLGTVLAVGFVAWMHYRSRPVIDVRRWWLAATIVVVVAGVGIGAARNTVAFQRYILHGNPQEQVQDLDSNDYHTLLMKQGLRGIAAAPLGHGPGTAGLASIHNPTGVQLTENYYIQIGYEVGVLGAALFIGLNVWLYRELRRRGGAMSAVLCGSFLAYVLTNMLLHTWGNEAVAAQWWIVAGMALAAGKNAGTQPDTGKTNA